MNRRGFIQTGGAMLAISAVPGCNARSSSDCIDLTTEVHAVTCRQKMIRDDLPNRLTAAMLIGAALGAGVAIAFHFNPIVGVIGGAMLGGGLVAVDTYIQYLKEQSGGDVVQMAALAQADVHADLKYAIMTSDDTKKLCSSVRVSLANNNGELLENAQKVAKAQETLKLIGKNKKAFQIAHAVYQNVDSKTQLLKTEQAQIDMKKTRFFIDDIEEEERSLFAMTG